jgi:hypothetical protein
MAAKIDLGKTSHESEMRAPDTEPPVYVSQKDYRTLTRNMEAFKAGSSGKKIGSDGDSFGVSSEESGETDEGPSRKRTRWSSSGSGGSDGDIERVITADVDEVPHYRVHCCRQHYTSPNALFAHLRVSHKVGTNPNRTNRCKLCRALVNEDLLMLHFELLHCIMKVKVFKVVFGITEDGQKNRYVKLVRRCRN